jgi:hypothetical protein
MSIMYKLVQSSFPDKNGRKLFYPTVRQTQVFTGVP